MGMLLGIHAGFQWGKLLEVEWTVGNL